MNLDRYTPQTLMIGPPARGPRWTLRIGIVGFAALLVWAWQSEIDQVTRAPAQIIAAQRTQLVQSADGGTIKTLLVQEGDTVVPGQLLAELQKNRASALTQDTQAKVAALKITLTRLRAEISDKPLRFDANLNQYAEYINNQQALYVRRKQLVNEEVRNLQVSLDLVKQELRMNEPLLVSGDISQTDILKLRRQVSELQGQISSRRNRYFQEAQAELTKAEEDLRSQQEALQDRQQVLANTRLEAPAAGVIKNILVNTVGGVMRAGDTFAEIVPTQSELIAEAKVSPGDIAFVKVGQTAFVSLDAYDPAIFGYIPGEVSYISPDTLTGEATSSGRATYYRVLVKLQPNALGSPDKQKLVKALAGMTASVSIKSQERTVLSYLTKPIIKTQQTSMGEH